MCVRMEDLFRFACASLAVLCLLGSEPARAQATDGNRLEELSRELERRWDRRRSARYYDLLRSDNPVQRRLNDNPGIELMGFDGRGHPIYYITHNANAAATTRTTEVWPGGGSGHNLSGSDTSPGVLGIWDGGLANADHIELVGRVHQGDAWSLSDPHATHVGATMIAAGVDPAARGMSYAGHLLTCRWDDDTVEMAQHASSGLQISNHSYGYATGWNGLQWHGEMTVSATEDYRFGFYDTLAAEWDQIAYSAPLYLIVKSAGNDRNDQVGSSTHNHLVNGQWESATDSHPPDGSPFGFDTIGTIGCAKNVLTVGAVEDIPDGYTQPGDVVQTDFSSWGPTDDGRIKPDIVANGDSVYSAYTYPDDNTSYKHLSGTSMATPNVSGSINLIRELYENTYSDKPLASTLKALVLHTADEAGAADGPDYSNGWGLLNTRAAADLVTSAPTSGSGHVEALLVSGTTDDYYFNVAAPGDARVTVVWMDPAGTPPPVVVDPVAIMLVNDLDVTLEHLGPGTLHFPWKLDKNNPLGVASRGDNDVDNVECIDAYNIPAGNYRVAVTHEGTITGGEQPYSLVWSGLVPTSPTATEPDASPPRFTLAIPYPNPASGGKTSITFSTPSVGPVSMEVYDARGRHVKTLVRGVQAAGHGSVHFDTSALPSGVYFVKMQAGSQHLVRKIAVVR